MDWKKLSEIPVWSPMNVLKSDFILLDSNHQFYKIDEYSYFKTTPYNDETLERKPGGPFISLFLWASSEGAARRAMLREIENDDGKELLPPKELLPTHDSYTKGRIYESLKQMNIRYITHGAYYRIAKDGAFIHQSISTKVAAYFFRSKKHDNYEEIPYAIQWRMIGYKEEKKKMRFPKEGWWTDMGLNPNN